jgi:CBS domain-containing protein
MNATESNLAARLVLRGETASDLMSPEPVSLHPDATLPEALAFFIDRNVSGAAVLDETGRPIGVVSHSDILIHHRERTPAPAGSPPPVRELMTPAVFCVRADSPAHKVVEQMRELNVHRLFVTDDAGRLVGVVTAMDVLRKLEAE